MSNLFIAPPANGPDGNAPEDYIRSEDQADDASLEEGADPLSSAQARPRLVRPDILRHGFIPRFSVVINHLNKLKKTSRDRALEAAIKPRVMKPTTVLTLDGRELHPIIVLNAYMSLYNAQVI